MHIDRTGVRFKSEPWNDGPQNQSASAAYYYHHFQKDYWLSWLGRKDPNLGPPAGDGDGGNHAQPHNPSCPTLFLYGETGAVMPPRPAHFGAAQLLLPAAGLQQSQHSNIRSKQALIAICLCAVSGLGSGFKEWGRALQARPDSDVRKISPGNHWFMLQVGPSRQPATLKR